MRTKLKIFILLCVLILLVSIVSVSACEITDSGHNKLKVSTAEFNAISHKDSNTNIVTICGEKYIWSVDSSGYYLVTPVSPAPKDRWASSQQLYLYDKDLGKYKKKDDVRNIAPKNNKDEGDLFYGIQSNLIPDSAFDSPNKLAKAVAKIRMSGDVIPDSIKNKINSGDITGARADLQKIRDAQSMGSIKNLIPDENVRKTIVNDKTNPIVTNYIAKLIKAIDDGENVNNAKKVLNDVTSTLATPSKDTDFADLSTRIQTSINTLPEDNANLKTQLQQQKVDVDKWQRAKEIVNDDTKWSVFITDYNTAGQQDKTYYNKIISDMGSKNNPQLYFDSEVSKLSDVTALQNSLNDKVSANILNDIINRITDPTQRRTKLLILDEADKLGIDLTGATNLKSVETVMNKIKGFLRNNNLDSENLPDSIKNDLTGALALDNAGINKLSKDIKNVGDKKKLFDRATENVDGASWDNFKNLEGDQYDAKFDRLTREAEVNNAIANINAFNDKIFSENLHNINIISTYNLDSLSLNQINALIRDAEQQLLAKSRNLDQEKFSALLDALKNPLPQSQSVTSPSIVNTPDRLRRLLDGVTDTTEITKITYTYNLGTDLGIDLRANENFNSFNDRVAKEALNQFRTTLNNIQNPGDSGLNRNTFGENPQEIINLFTSIQYLLNNNPNDDRLRHQLLSTLIVAQAKGEGLNVELFYRSSWDDIIGSTLASNADKEMYKDFVTNGYREAYLNALIKHIDETSANLKEEYKVVKVANQDVSDWFNSLPEDSDERTKALNEFGFTDIKQVTDKDGDTFYVAIDTKGRTHIVSGDANRGDLNNEDSIVPANSIQLNTGFISKYAGTRDVSAQVYIELAKAKILDHSQTISDQKFIRDGTLIYSTDNEGNKDKQIAFAAFVGDNVYVADNKDDSQIQIDGETNYRTSSGRILSKDGNLRDDVIVVDKGNIWTNYVQAKLTYDLDLGFPVYKDEFGNFYNQKGENINQLLKDFAQPLSEDGNSFTDAELAKEAIANRQAWQDFWGTILEGPKGPIERAKVDWATGKLKSEGLYSPSTLESSFWKPQDWEKKLCEVGVPGLLKKRERPRDVKFNTDKQGNQIISMTLQGSKQQIPASIINPNTGEEEIGTTNSYEVGWSVSPVNEQIEYTICLGGCTNCYLLGTDKSERVTVGKGQSSGSYAGVTSSLDVDTVSICYLEGESSTMQEYKVPIVKGKDYSGFDASSQGPNNVGTSPSSKPQTAKSLPK